MKHNDAHNAATDIHGANPTGAKSRSSRLPQLALLLATCPDVSLRRPDEAVRLAERARRMTGAIDVNQLAVLAEVYAEARRFDEAVGATEEALKLSHDAGDAEMAGRLQRELKRYKDRISSDSPRN